MGWADRLLGFLAMVLVGAGVVVALLALDRDPPATETDVEANLTAIECTVALLMVEPTERREIPDQHVATVCGIPVERVAASRTAFQVEQPG
jgi:hypothetical protein